MAGEEIVLEVDISPRRGAQGVRAQRAAREAMNGVNGHPMGPQNGPGPHQNGGGSSSGVPSDVVAAAQVAGWRHAWQAGADFVTMDMGG